MIIAECSFKEFVYSGFFEEFSEKDKYGFSILKNETAAIKLGVRTKTGEIFDDLIAFYYFKEGPRKSKYIKVAECSDMQATDDISVSLEKRDAGVLNILIQPLLVEGRKKPFWYTPNDRERRALEDAIDYGSEEYFPGLKSTTEMTESNEPVKELEKTIHEEEVDMEHPAAPIVPEELKGMTEKLTAMDVIKELERTLDASQEVLDAEGDNSDMHAGAQAQLDFLKDTVASLKKLALLNEKQAAFKNFKEEKSDGWPEGVEDTFNSVFSSSEEFMYEVRNCVRGCYTGASTLEGLQEAARSIAEEWNEAAMQLDYVDDPDIDEDEDEDDEDLDEDDNL